MLAPLIEPIWNTLTGHQRAQLQERAEARSEIVANRLARTTEAAKKKAEADRHRKWEVFQGQIYLDHANGVDPKTLMDRVQEFGRANEGLGREIKPLLDDLKADKKKGQDERIDTISYEINSGGYDTLAMRKRIDEAPIYIGDKAKLIKQLTDKNAANHISDADAYKQGLSLIKTVLGSSIGADFLQSSLGSVDQMSQARDLLGKAEGEYMRGMEGMYKDRDTLNAQPRNLSIVTGYANAIITRYQDTYPTFFKKAQAPGAKPAPSGEPSKTPGDTNKTPIRPPKDDTDGKSRSTWEQFKSLIQSERDRKVTPRQGGQ
jgi:hypothetical protein